MKNPDLYHAGLIQSGYAGQDYDLLKELKSKNIKEVIHWLKSNNSEIKESLFPKIANDINDLILANNKISTQELLLLKDLNNISFNLKGVIGASEKQLYAFSLEVFYMMHNYYTKPELNAKMKDFCFDSFLDDHGVYIEKDIFKFIASIKGLKDKYKNSKTQVLDLLVHLKKLVHLKYAVEQEILLPRLLKIRKEFI